MQLYAVTYAYATGSATGRDNHRARHLDFLQGLFDEGTLVVSGPTGADSRTPGALLIIRAASTESADALMAADPFAREGYVHRTVTLWEPKFGASRLEGAA